MGVWNWIVDTLTGQDNASTPDAGGPPAPAEATGTATLEPPTDAASTDTVSEWWSPADACYTESQPASPPEMSTEARALENALVSHFDGHDLTIPALPRVPEGVLGLLRARDCNFGEVAQLIAEDQVMAAAVIRMANSPIYGGINKISALQPAVNRLGSNALRTLMMHHSLRAATFSGGTADRELAGLLWNRSLASAHLMRCLATFTGIDKEEASLIGLLHDIGNVIVLRETQKQQDFLHYKIDVDTFEYLCFQCHQEFGELVAEEWQLPPGIRALLIDHHTCPTSDDPYRVARWQLQLTGMINALLGYAPWAPYDLLQAQPTKELDLDHHRGFEALLPTLPQSLADALHA